MAEKKDAKSPVDEKWIDAAFGALQGGLDALTGGAEARRTSAARQAALMDTLHSQFDALQRQVAVLTDRSEKYRDALLKVALSDSLEEILKIAKGVLKEKP